MGSSTAGTLVNLLGLAVGAAGVAWSGDQYRWIYEVIFLVSIAAAIIVIVRDLHAHGRLRLVEPWHIIIAGLLIAGGGVMWQQYRANVADWRHSDPFQPPPAAAQPAPAEAKPLRFYSTKEKNKL